MGEYTTERPLCMIELFAGIGSQTQALKNIGVPHKVVAISEIDKYAIKSYEAMHGKSNNLGDIREIKELPRADLWTYSFPCQDISVAGKLAGIKDGTRSGLLFEVERLLRVAETNVTLPKYLLLENVKNLVCKRFKADFDLWLDFLSSLGYKNYWKILNAKDYGIPQNRERVFCVSIKGDHPPFVFPEKQEIKLRLKDMLDRTVDERYYLKESTIRSILHSNFHSRRNRINNSDTGSVATICARDYKEPQCVQVGELVGGKWDRMHDISKRVYEPDGLSPTVHCAQGGNTEIKIAAMRGRDKETESDNGEVKHTEQRLEFNEKGTCNALTSVQKDNLVVEKKDYVSRRYGEFIDKKGYLPEMFNAYNGAEVKDIAPTLTGQCCSYTGSSSILKAEKKEIGSLLHEDSQIAHTIRTGGHGSVDRHAWDTIIEKENTEEYTLLAPNNWGHKAGDGTITRERRETEICPALQASPGQTQHSYLKIRNSTKKGYAEATEGDYVNLSYPNSKSKRGRVGKGIAQTLTCGESNGYVTENIRIRKLTARECLRLMGWKDEQIDKIESSKVSSTQQYRQAGNGIVVQVLESIFKALFLSEAADNG
ncbi:MAG: DNA (cytosine-5-)-methyltransferase [Clostridia bacterium]|nr:DNA (cytosine-5-)-methyltransferase [Clostridia bacterium]